MKRRMLKLTALAGTAVTALSLAACGGGGSGGSSGSSDRGNTLVYAGEAGTTINPLLDSYDEVTRLIFSGLTKEDESGKPVGDLAESYDYDMATHTYTFHLKQNVKWHDGTPFTADDVIFTYDQLVKSDAVSDSLKANYEDITSVTAPDANTVVFTLSQNDNGMLEYFTIGILPKHIYEGQDLSTTEYNQKPVGTGKYKFASWDTGANTISLDKNEDYYGNVPNIDHINYRIVEDETTKAQLVESGEVDLAWLHPKYAEKFRTNSDYTVWDFPSADYRGVAFNFGRDFWSKNKDSAGVLNYAIDKDKIVDSVLKGQGASAYSPIQKNPLGSTTEADIYTYDLDKFAEEMAKLGWVKGSDGIYERNGEKFHFTTQVREYEEERVEIANLTSSMLKQAGVDMEVVLVPKFDHASYDSFLAGYSTEYDPDMIYSNYYTTSPGNNMKYSNAEVDKYLEEGRHAETEAERKEAYKNFEIAYAKEPAVLLVSYINGNYVSTKSLTGLNTKSVLGHHARGVMWNVEEWTLNR